MDFDLRSGRPIDAGRVYKTPDGKIGTLPEDANIILASAKAEARTADCHLDDHASSLTFS